MVTTVEILVDRLRVLTNCGLTKTNHMVSRSVLPRLGQRMKLAPARNRERLSDAAAGSRPESACRAGRRTQSGAIRTELPDHNHVGSLAQNHRVCFAKRDRAPRNRKNEVNIMLLSLILRSS